MKQLKSVSSYVGHILASVLDARTFVALAGVGLLAIGVAGKWDTDTAFIVTGIILLAATVWPSVIAMFVVRGAPK